MRFDNRDSDGKDEWLTPPSILNALGKFDLDPCAPINAPWPTAANHFTITDDGLAQEWFGRVFMNPPYGRAVSEWMAKLANYGRGTALIFARTDTEWFFRSVWDRATGLFFLRSHLHFHHVTGERAKHNSGAPSVLVAYGMDDLDQMAESGLGGKLVPLRVPRLVALMSIGAEETWSDAVLQAVKAQGGPMPLDKLYRVLSSHPKTERNPNWRAKVRQTLQRGPFERVETGVWRAA